MASPEPFISVIVPAYNRADLIGKTVESLQKQDYENYEIIIVDDGSTDNTEEVVAGIADRRVRYFRKANEERAAARNFGARKANGVYINFFDSDDIALPGHLAEAARVISDRNSPEWFHLGFAWADPDGVIFKEINRFAGKTLNYLMTEGNPLSCNGVFVRKDIMLEYPFNEDRNLSASEDYELWVRLAARFPLYYSNTITSLVIDHDSRSVRTISGTKLIRRLQLLVHYLQQDEKVVAYFGKHLHRIKADSYSYVALHLADYTKFKTESVAFLTKAFFIYPGLAGKKRFYATLKNLLSRWQKS